MWGGGGGFGKVFLLVLCELCVPNESRGKNLKKGFAEMHVIIYTLSNLVWNG